MSAWWDVFRRDTKDIEDRRTKPRAWIAIGVSGGLGFMGAYACKPVAETAPPIVVETRTRTAQTDFLDFTSAILGDLADRWAEQFKAEGLGTYHPPKVVLYTEFTNTRGCDNARTEQGPFLCPADDTIYLDPWFFSVIRSGIPLCKTAPDACDFAQAYVIAHEHGHHIQLLLGIIDRMSGGPSIGVDSASVRLELQADCLGGVWGGLTNSKWHEVAKAFVTAAWQSAWWSGDDHQGAPPSQYTHGTSEQRTKWFLKGYDFPRYATCDTWRTDDL